ncbi:response regulator [Larkinella insperata]|uniref:Response regulator n=1 Tax=Larkinella insperata TaxID=332158 RepID=A0ABW3Q691_9BACT|nr:response regulator [Larkinella insperata]
MTTQGPVIFLATDQESDHFLYRQALYEACPTAVLYFFGRKGEMLQALRGSVFPLPSLLILDWKMAERNGYPLLNRLNQTPAWQHIPVVIIDSDPPSVDQQKCKEAGYEMVLPAEKVYENVVERLRGLAHALIL